jgi:MFS family permease
LNDSDGRHLRLLTLVQLANGLRGAVISPILALFIHGQGFTLTEIGFLGTAGVLGWFIFEPVMGVFADRFKKKYLISFAIICSSIVYALYPYATNFLHFSILAFSMSSVMSAYAISVKALAAELIPPENRGKTYGRYTAVISLGGIIGPIVGGYIAEQYGISLPFYIAALLGGVSLLAVGFMKVDGDSSSRENRSEGIDLRGLFTPTLMGLYLVRTIFMFNLMFRKYSLPIYLNEAASFSAGATEIGVFLSVVSVSSTISKVFIGDIVDRLGTRLMMTSSVCTLSITYFLLTRLTGLESLYIIGLLQGVTIAAAELSMMIQLMSIIPEGRTGIVMGLYSEAENVGAIIASPFLGYMYDSQGPENTILALSAILLINALIAWAAMRKRLETS